MILVIENTQCCNLLDEPVNILAGILVANSQQDQKPLLDGTMYLSVYRHTGMLYTLYYYSHAAKVRLSEKKTKRFLGFLEREYLRPLGQEVRLSEKKTKRFFGFSPIPPKGCLA
jgi:hypothetical protein